MNPKIARLLKIAHGAGGLMAARERAKSILPEFPHNGCATFLSCLLEAAGIDCGIHENAGDLAATLAGRGWEKAGVEHPQKGDVAVTDDANGNGMPDHIFLIVVPLKGASCLIADNQASYLHARRLDGSTGQTPTAYLLRAPA